MGKSLSIVCDVEEKTCELTTVSRRLPELPVMMMNVPRGFEGVLIVPSAKVSESCFNENKCGREM